MAERDHQQRCRKRAFPEHYVAVDRISRQVAQFHARNQPYRIYHGSTNSTRTTHFTKTGIVDTSKLNNVLRINKERATATVEPNVSMSELVDACLKAGFLPPVVPEFPNITVGGAFNGTAGESSSFKHGFFDRTVHSIEVVLADGKLVGAKANDWDIEKQALFWAMAGSFGTLGLTTLFEVRLERIAGKNVLLDYMPVYSMDEAVQTLKAETARPSNHDFVDGILFSSTSGMILTGRIVPDAESRSLLKTRRARFRRFSRPWHRWFYLHVSDQLRRVARDPSVHTASLIPIKDYLFRYDVSAFWMGQEVFPLWHVPFNRFSQAVAAPFLHTRTLYGAMHLSGAMQKFIIQDLVMPADDPDPSPQDEIEPPHSGQRDMSTRLNPTTALLSYLDKNMAIYPLWLCPILGVSPAMMHRHALEVDDEPRQLINIGTWGVPRAPRIHSMLIPRASNRGYDPGSLHSMDQWLADNRALEAELQRLGGKKWLYAQTFYENEEQFHKGIAVSKQWYNAARERYGAKGLPSLWEKLGGVRKEQPRRVKKRRGLLALVGGEYLLKG